jgi:hypothetical protein
MRQVTRKPETIEVAGPAYAKALGAQPSVETTETNIDHLLRELRSSS